MFTDHVHYACYQNGEMISESTVLFSVPKYYDYIDPQLSCRVEGDEIIVSAKAYANARYFARENARKLEKAVTKQLFSVL